MSDQETPDEHADEDAAFQARDWQTVETYQAGPFACGGPLTPYPALAKTIFGTDADWPGTREEWVAAREIEQSIRDAVGGVLFNASNYPEPVRSRILGQDTRPLTEKVVRAVMAAISAPQPVRDEVRRNGA